MPEDEKWRNTDLPTPQLSNILVPRHFVNLTFCQLDIFANQLHKTKHAAKNLTYSTFNFLFLTLAQCYKTFYGRNLQMFVIS